MHFGVGGCILTNLDVGAWLYSEVLHGSFCDIRDECFQWVNKKNLVLSENSIISYHFAKYFESALLQDKNILHRI